MQWDLDSDRPIYTQLVEYIEKFIVAGEYKPGEKLPAVRELAAQAGVNPNTMQRALAELEARGLLQSQRTSGRYVTDDAGMIASLRDELARKTTGEYMYNMGALRYTKPEILKFVQDEPEVQTGVKQEEEPI